MAKSLIESNVAILGEYQWGFGCRHIARDSNDRLYAISVNATNGVDVSYSDDDGANWTLDTTLVAGTSMAFKPTICVGTNDNVYVAFNEQITSPYTIQTWKRDSGTGVWSNVHSWTALTSANNAAAPCLVASRSLSNRIYVMTLLSNNNPSYYCRYTDNNGGAWTSSDTTDAGSYPTANYAYDLASKPDGTLVLIRAWNTAGTCDYVIYNNAGGTTGSSGNLGMVNGGDAVGGASICVDSSGNVRCAWYEFNFTTNLRVNFPTTQNLFTSQMVKGSLSMGLDGNSNVYVFWSKASDNKVYYRKFTYLTSTWGTETLLTADASYRVRAEQRAPAASAVLNLLYTQSS